jgi:hypothetical protein
MSDSVRDDILRVLRDLGDEFIGPGLVLIVILVLALVFSVLIRTGGRRAGVNIRFEWNPGRGPGAVRGPTVDNISVVANANDAAQPRPSRLDKLRTILVIVYRGLHLAGAIALLLGAIWAYMAATPGNGLLLVAILLFALSLIADRPVPGGECNANRSQRDGRTAQQSEGLDVLCNAASSQLG